MKHKILVVEDEPAMRLGLQDNLEFEGYAVECAADGLAGLAAIQQQAYDLIILDVMMPQMSGFEVCKRMRKEGIETPVILLTAKGEEIDKVLGLELGADDYITKPFGLRELLARIKAVLRRTVKNDSSHEGQVMAIGRLNIDFAAYEAFEGQSAVKLSHKEFEILKFLIDHHDRPVSRNELLSEVWGYEAELTTRTVDNFIARLRQKVEWDVHQPKVILTVHGVGYRLVGKKF